MVEHWAAVFRIQTRIARRLVNTALRLDCVFDFDAVAFFWARGMLPMVMTLVGLAVVLGLLSLLLLWSLDLSIGSFSLEFVLEAAIAVPDRIVLIEAVLTHWSDLVHARDAGLQAILKCFTQIFACQLERRMLLEAGRGLAQFFDRVDRAQQFLLVHHSQLPRLSVLVTVLEDLDMAAVECFNGGR